MTKEKLTKALTGMGIGTTEVKKVLSVWPQWEDGEFIDTDFVGPRPHRPPHQPESANNESE